MIRSRVTLEEAVKFHGHLGPYLVLGILAGELAARELKFKKHFGLQVKVWGADKKPKSCLIDGLQLSTGATYGKGNIKKFNGPAIRIEFYNCPDDKKIALTFKDSLALRLRDAKTHKESEVLARELYRQKHLNIFNVSGNQ